MAVVDGVDALDQSAVDTAEHGGVAFTELQAVFLPEQTEGGVQDAVAALAGITLVMVEAPLGRVVATADVEHDVRAAQDGLVTAANDGGVGVQLLEQRYAEDVVCMELAVMGRDDHPSRLGNRARGCLVSRWCGCGSVAGGETGDPAANRAVKASRSLPAPVIWVEFFSAVKPSPPSARNLFTTTL